MSGGNGGGNRGGGYYPPGTGGVRSPSGPYGPPGFVGGPTRSGPGGSGGMYAGGPGGTIMNQSLPTGGAEPYNAGASTTGGPSYAVNPGPAPYGGMGGPAPTNYISPAPPGTGGIKPPPGSVGSNEMGYLTPGSGPLLPNDPAWFSSPQGLQQQLAMARRVMGPYAALAPGRAGQPHERVVPGSGPREGPNTSPYSLPKGAQSAMSQANWANPDWRMQQVLAGAIAPTNNAELQAMIAQMSPADRQAYIDRYKSIGLDVTYQGGGGTGPFGN